jgi:3-phenylpropionate/cinnamic acid dioxygenase small subunit
MNRQDAFFIAQDFLALESKLLDERRFEEWLALMDDDIVYHVPIREARVAYADEHGGGGYRIRDNKALLKVRVDRLNSGYAWAEIPPSRTTRVVGSVMAQPAADGTIAVESAMLMYRQRGHDAPGEVIPVRRRDVLKVTDEGVRLLRRDAFIAEVVLTTSNLGVFL